MNLLTIPAMGGGASHIIPLFVLHQRYFSKMYGTLNHFLISKEQHIRFRNLGVRVLPIDYGVRVELKMENIQKLRKVVRKSELKAFSLVNPSLILEDNSFSSPLIAEKNNVPRISIHRTGFFRSLPIGMRNPMHMHSLEKGFQKKKSFDASLFFNSGMPNLKIKKNRTDINFLKNYLNPKTKLIPGIPSIEVLPSNIKNKESYFYTGPLTVADNPSEKLKQELNAFFELNKNKKKVFITLGLIDQGNITNYINYLLNKGYAVISTSKIAILKETKNRYFYNGFLPLNFICSKVDLIIHQCGSGMYHYPILNNKPAITIGTQCYDREDVALRLQMLGISKHVPHKNDDGNYLTVFKERISDFEEGKLCDFNKLKELENETYDTMLQFDMEEVIQFTLNNSKVNSM